MADYRFDLFRGVAGLGCIDESVDLNPFVVGPAQGGGGEYDRVVHLAADGCFGSLSDHTDHFEIYSVDGYVLSYGFFLSEQLGGHIAAYHSHFFYLCIIAGIDHATGIDNRKLDLEVVALHAKDLSGC